MDIKKLIWDLFPYYYDKHDPNPDGDGKGILRRLMEVFGEEWDENLMKHLDEDSDDYYLHNLNPLLADERFINILADILGNPPIILDEQEYAKLLKYIVAIYKVKGSKLAYQIFFGLLGFNVEINPISPTVYDPSKIFYIPETGITELTNGVHWYGDNFHIPPGVTLFQFKDGNLKGLVYLNTTTEKWSLQINETYTEQEVQDLIDQDDFIPISTPADLFAIRSTDSRVWAEGTSHEITTNGGFDKKYILINDIDLSFHTSNENGDYYNGGQGWQPAGIWPISGHFFIGEFDGGGHYIEGLYINRPSNDQQGIFAHADGAKVINVGLIHSDVTGRDRVGSLIGRCNGTELINCYSHGKVHGRNNVGGLAGRIEATSYAEKCNNYASVSATMDGCGGVIGFSYITCHVEDCHNFANIDGGVARTGGVLGDNRQESELLLSTNFGRISGQDYVGGVVGNNCVDSVTKRSLNYGTVMGTGFIIGGLCGWNDIDATVENCHNTGDVFGDDKVGGLVGSNDHDGSILINSYSVGKVEGNTNVGGLIGFQHENSDTEDSYWDVERSQQPNSADGIGLTTEQMTYPYDAAAYVGWDFVNIWQEDTTQMVNIGYPYLKGLNY